MGMRAHPSSGGFTVSCGSPTLDYYIGGGLRLGAVTLLAEAGVPSAHSALILRGLIGSSQTTLVVSPRINLLTTSPDTPTSGTGVAPAGNNASSDDADLMKIAWRYAALPAGADEPAVRPKAAPATPGVLHTFPLHSSPTRQSLWDWLQPHLAAGNCRVILDDFMSPLYGDGSPYKLLLQLRGAVRGTTSTVVLVASQVGDTELPGLTTMADCVLLLDSFELAPRFSPLYQHLTALLTIVKQTSVNQLATPECRKLGVKVKNQTAVVEPLHLPPDLSETASRSCASAASW